MSVESERPEDFFDLSLNKKKKKKKAGFKLEDGNATLGGDEVAATTEAVAKNDESKENQKTVDAGTGAGAAVLQQPDTSSVHVYTAKWEGVDSILREKKKKKRGLKLNYEVPDDAIEFWAIYGTKKAAVDAVVTDKALAYPWIGSDRDYEYPELLMRAFDILKERNPDMASGSNKTVNVPQPLVSRAGAKRTSFDNFNDICKALHRQQDHVMAFIMAELDSHGSLDGRGQGLTIRGRFNQKNIENILRSYIKEYVTCHTCRSPNTIIDKQDRLSVLICEECKAQSTVVSVKKVGKK